MKHVPLVVGMPVYRRAWALGDWFDSYEAQDPPDGTRLIFALSPSQDGTEQIIARRAPDAEVIYVEGLPTFEEDEKDHPHRYAVLAAIRNRLLRAVGTLSPDAYLSWDSDIVLEPGGLRELLRPRVAAAGALVDMGGDVFPGHWSWMHLEGTDAYRTREAQRLPYAYLTRPFRVGVIMGVKLLRPEAYLNGRYADHPLGEDVGFAIGLERLGIERWLVPTARGVHRYRFSPSTTAAA